MVIFISNTHFYARSATRARSHRLFGPASPGAGLRLEPTVGREVWHLGCKHLIIGNNDGPAMIGPSAGEREPLQAMTHRGQPCRISATVGSALVGDANIHPPSIVVSVLQSSPGLGFPSARLTVCCQGRGCRKQREALFGLRSCWTPPKSAGRYRNRAAFSVCTSASALL